MADWVYQGELGPSLCIQIATHHEESGQAELTVKAETGSHRAGALEYKALGTQSWGYYL